MDFIERKKIDRIIQLREGKIVGPTRISWHPTNRCNLDCLFCGTKNMKLNMIKDELDSSRINKLIQESKDLDALEWVIFGGGEPLLKKNIIDYMKRIKRLGMRGTLITNGTLLSPNSIGEMIKMRWDFIEFSIDSPFESTQDYLRNQKGSFKSVIKALRIFKSIKKKEGSIKPHIIIRSVVNNKNYFQLNDMISLAHEFDCMALELNELIMNPNSYSEDLKLNEKERNFLRKNLTKFKKKCKNKHIKLILNLDLINRQKKMLVKNIKRRVAYCFLPFTEIMIRPDGSISYCCPDIKTFTNINNKKLQSIWFGSYYNEKRKKLLNFQIDEDCKKCNPDSNINHINLNKELLKYHLRV